MAWWQMFLRQQLLQIEFAVVHRAVACPRPLTDDEHVAIDETVLFQVTLFIELAEDGVGVQHVVRTEKIDPVPGSTVDAPIHRLVRTSIRTGLDPNARKPLLAIRHDREGSVGRTTIDDPVFQPVVGLIRYTQDGIFDRCRSIQRGRDHGNSWLDHGRARCLALVQLS